MCRERFAPYGSSARERKNGSPARWLTVTDNAPQCLIRRAGNLAQTEVLCPLLQASMRLRMFKRIPCRVVADFEGCAGL